jgi:hypothetical protein
MRLNELTTSINAGTNLVPCRFLKKVIRRPNFKKKNLLFRTDKEKNNERSRKIR